jgi:hypothetical protein
MTGKPGPVANALSKLIGAVLLSQTATLLMAKHCMKASDVINAQFGSIATAAYFGYFIWAHAAGHTKSLEGLISTGVMFFLNAYIAYA